MIRVSETIAAAGTTALRVEGRLVGGYVEQLRFLCFALAAQRQSLLFDLTGLLFADREGVKLLRSLKASRAAFTGCSPVLAAQLSG
jgi:hypothetical protein